MTILTINNIPNDVLGITFDYLDIDDLKGCRLVCKKFKASAETPLKKFNYSITYFDSESACDKSVMLEAKHGIKQNNIIDEVKKFFKLSKPNCINKMTLFFKNNQGAKLIFKHVFGYNPKETNEAYLYVVPSDQEKNCLIHIKSSMETAFDKEVKPGHVYMVKEVGVYVSSKTVNNELIDTINEFPPCQSSCTII